MIEIRVINWPSGPCAAGPSHSLVYNGDDADEMAEFHERQFAKALADAELIRGALAHLELNAQEPCKCSVGSCCPHCRARAIKARHAEKVGESQ